MAGREQKLLNIFTNIITTLPILRIRCNSNSKLYNSERFLHRFTWLKCRKKFSLLENTPFYYKKLAVIDVLLIIKLWSAKVKQTTICEFLELGQRFVRKVI